MFQAVKNGVKGNILWSNLALLFAFHYSFGNRMDGRA
jgi:hypothetical protein